MRRMFTLFWFMVLISCSTPLPPHESSRGGDDPSVQQSVDALYQQAVELQKNGDLEQAVALYGQVIEMQPEHAKAYSNRGLIHLMQKRYSLATADYYKVTELEPDIADGYGVLGWTLILQGRFAEAREPCRKAFKLDQGNYALAVNFGHIYLLVGENQTAYDFYKKSLSLIKTKQELQQGPLADFSLFIEQNW